MRGVEAQPSADTITYLQQKLQQTGVFSDVTLRPTAADDLFRLRFDVKETHDPHQGEATLKGALAGLTFGLLLPAVWLRYEYESAMTLDVQRPDGVSKSYSARSSGEARFQVFANSYLAGEEIRNKVRADAINALATAVAADSPFLAGR